VFVSIFWFLITIYAVKIETETKVKRYFNVTVFPFVHYSSL